MWEENKKVVPLGSFDISAKQFSLNLVETNLKQGSLETQVKKKIQSHKIILTSTGIGKETFIKVLQ